MLGLNEGTEQPQGDRAQTTELCSRFNHERRSSVVADAHRRIGKESVCPARILIVPGLKPRYNPAPECRCTRSERASVTAVRAQRLADPDRRTQIRFPRLVSRNCLYKRTIQLYHYLRLITRRFGGPPASHVMAGVRVSQVEGIAMPTRRICNRNWTAIPRMFRGICKPARCTGSSDSTVRARGLRSQSQAPNAVAVNVTN